MAYQSSGEMPEQLANEIELPEVLMHVWEYFIDLHSERTYNGVGPNPVTSTGIKDWCWVNRIRLESWEIKAIKRIDNIWFEFINRE